MGLILPNKRLFLWQMQIAKKKPKFKKINDIHKFLVGSVDNLQSYWNSDYQENVVKEYYKNGCGPCFDTFMQKMLYFLERSPIEKSHWTCLFLLRINVILSVFIYTNFNDLFE